LAPVAFARDGSVYRRAVSGGVIRLRGTNR
jgi:hypothetical protein